MTEGTRETFQLTTEVAEAYEAQFVPTFFAQWAPRLLDAAGVVEGQRVLDVACGTGILARTAADRVGGSGTAVGVDLSEGMLAVARRVRPELTWVQSDAAAMPFEEGEFDAVLSQMAMMFFPDPGAALHEMRRVVRSNGGTVGVLVPGPLRDNPPYQHFVDIVTRHAGQAARNLVTTYFNLGDQDLLVPMFTRAGLEAVTATVVVGESRFDSVDTLVNVEIDSTPLGERLDTAQRERILVDCREAIGAWLTADGTLSFPFTCNVVVGHR